MIIPPVLGLFAAGYVGGTGLLFLPLALALAATAWVFSSLTVEVSLDELTWYFGPGFWRKSIQRGEIASATPVRNKWWWGWGIHLTPGAGSIMSPAWMRSKLPCTMERHFVSGPTRPQHLRTPSAGNKARQANSSLFWS